MIAILQLNHTPRSAFLKVTTILAVVLGNTAPLVAYADTAVGNGGSIIEKYLRVSRQNLKDVLFKLEKSEDQKSLCNSQPDLNQDQIDECRNFIVTTRSDLLDLTIKVPFKLVVNPIYVDYPDGSRRKVAAQTQLGPQGNIDFHYDSIRTMSPGELMALLTHELGHKVDYQGSPVSDFEPTAAFASGLELLDAAGRAIANKAIDLGLISDHFGFYDLYQCQVVTDDDESKPKLIVSGGSIRKFFKQHVFDRYQSTIGHHPTDLAIKIYDTESQSHLALKVQVFEETDCDLNRPDGRSLSLEVVREFEENGKIKSESLNQLINDGYNPICEPEEQRQSFTISGGIATFSCQYMGGLALSRGI